MKHDLTISASLRLVGGGKLFGPGIAALLEGVVQNGSLRQSAMDMGMSYNKAFYIVKECEAQLGFTLLRRFKGGTGGGGAELTKEGRRLLADYRSFEQEAESALERLKEQYFSWITEEKEEDV